MPDVDAVVVGSGPNGLAAAIALAQAGLSVRVLEAGRHGRRRRALGRADAARDSSTTSARRSTRSGSASPFFRTLPLAEHGVEWIDPPAALAHPFDDGTAVAARALARRRPRAALGADAAALARSSSRRSSRDCASRCSTDLLAPLRLPRAPARARPASALRAALPATALAAAARFAATQARGALRGARGALDAAARPRRRARRSGSCSGCSAHAVGWPFPRGGSQRSPTRSPRTCARSAARSRPDGGSTRSPSSAPTRRVLLDVTPRGLLALAGDRLPPRYRRALERYRYGPGVFKLDWALDGPIPWRGRGVRARGDRPPRRHARGDRRLGAAAVARRDRRAAVRAARPAEPLRPDARAGRAAHGVGVLPRPERLDRRHDRADRGAGRALRARLPRPDPRALGARPGRRSSATTRTTSAATSTAARATLSQLFTRPVARVSPYTTPLPGVFLCSASTPPGGGVHGMCGYHAARAALRQLTGDSHAN